MTLKLNGSSSGSVSIDAPASTTSGADITFALPVADGTSGQALTTNASGQLQFASIVSQTTGAWTPSDGSGNGLSFSTAVGQYVLTGKICTVFCHTVWPSTSASGQVVIAGLPATVKNQAGDTADWDFTGGAGRVSVQGPNVNGDMTARGVKNTTTVKIWGSRGDGGGSGYQFPITTMGANASGVDTAGGILQFSLTYMVE